MRILKTVCQYISISALGLLASCGTSNQLMYPSHQADAKPNSRFIDGVLIAGGTKTLNNEVAATKTAVADNTKYIETFPGSKYLQGKYADMLHVIPDAVRSLKLYNFIEDWYGVKYSMGGNEKTGIDCSAFVRQLYDNVFRISLVRTSIEQCSTITSVIRKDELREGDLVFFRTQGKRISHVGVYLMNSYFVHASTGGVMISSLNEAYWSKRFAGAGYIKPNKG